MANGEINFFFLTCLLFLRNFTLTSQRSPKTEASGCSLFLDVLRFRKLLVAGFTSEFLLLFPATWLEPTRSYTWSHEKSQKLAKHTESVEEPNPRSYKTYCMYCKWYIRESSSTSRIMYHANNHPDIVAVKILAITPFELHKRKIWGARARVLRWRQQYRSFLPLPSMNGPDPQNVWLLYYADQERVWFMLYTKFKYNQAGSMRKHQLINVPLLQQAHKKLVPAQAE